MNATQVVIHFIGIVLFSTEVTNDPGLHAILPAIRQDFHQPPIGRLPQSVSADGASSASPGAAPDHSSAHVEPHVAMLIFHQDLILNESQWPTLAVVSKFPEKTSLAAYRYVELTGEHIAFVVDSHRNGQATLPPNMPRFSCGKTRLAKGYQWPYSDAAAMVDIPEGELSVCDAGTIAPGRMDTRLLLDTSGTLTVVAAKSGRVNTLVLRTTANPTIYMANVPLPRVKGALGATADAPHFQAYFDMLDRGRTTVCTGKPLARKGAPAVAGCVTRPVFRTLDPALAGADGGFSPPHRVVRAHGGVRPPVQPPLPLSAGQYHPMGIMFMANAECSNTQWP